jgi:uncharacterized protein YjbJ (UPF0337 family)
MTNTGEPSKVSGHSDEVMGNLKSGFGKVTGNRELEAKGNAQNAAGTTQVDAATAKQKVEAAGDSAKGNIKSAFGSLTGNERLQAEGNVDKARGDVKSRTA